MLISNRVGTAYRDSRNVFLILLSFPEHLRKIRWKTTTLEFSMNFWIFWPITHPPFKRPEIQLENSRALMKSLIPPFFKPKRTKIGGDMATQSWKNPCLWRFFSIFTPLCLTHLTLFVVNTMSAWVYAARNMSESTICRYIAWMVPTEFWWDCNLPYWICGVFCDRTLLGKDRRSQWKSDERYRGRGTSWRGRDCAF